MADTDNAQRLMRARSYPYTFPLHSYTWQNGTLGDFDDALTRDRTPVLAIGSNQAPERLTQKFGRDADHVIPVQRARVDGFDVVFSAHITAYGSVPAMLQTSPGSTVSVAVTWLNDEQLEIMHHSEIAAANYWFAELEPVSVTLDNGAVHSKAWAYLSSRGHLSLDRAPLALSAIACDGRRYRAISTADALELVRARVAAELDADVFVHRLIDDVAWRQQVIDAISGDAGAFEHPMRILRSGPSGGD